MKNVIEPFMVMRRTRMKYNVKWKRGDKEMVVYSAHSENVFELFGGNDERSYMLIQGRTLAGVLLDEVVLMPRSFVEQALTRCSVDGSKLWFNCNPGGPQHWFYTEWIQKREQRNALYLHFTMEDNPGLSEKIKQDYKLRFSGVFYQRYVLGQWTLAEGLIYPNYDNTVQTSVREYEKYYISMDYGILNPTAMILWGLYNGVWYAVREFYHSGRESHQQKTDGQYYEDLERLADGLPIARVIVDPSASSFITLIEQQRKYKVWAADNEVIEGIQHVAECLSNKSILFNDCCTMTISEFGAYRWDEKKSEDKPIKSDDHCLTGDTLVDTTEGAKRIDELVGTEGEVYCTDGKKVQIGRFHSVRQTQAEAEVYEVRLNDGRTVTATAEHPILTKRGWVKLKDLHMDDEIACIGGFWNEGGVQRGQ